jgi:signal transduction histidine kinase
MASLFVIRGSDQGTRIELEEGALTIGRDKSNGIQLHDTEVSRRHVEVRCEKSKCSICDMKSSNGTFMNGERVETAQLRSGDRLQVGRTLMIFTGGDESDQRGLENLVNIVVDQRSGGDSRIVQSLSQQEGSSLIDDIHASTSPWLARARSNLQIMYRTALAVSHTLDIDQLLNRILEMIFEWVEADRGCIMLLNQATDELEPKVRRTRRGSTDEKINLSRRILDYVMDHKEGVLTSDASDDRRWDPGGSVVQMGVREAICVPMQGRYGIVGIVYIDTFTPPGRILEDGATRKFNEEHLKLMIAIGHQAALAIEDTSYYSAMVQAERLAAVGQTIATLSHHIKNILQGIRGGSYLIQEGLNGDEPGVVRKGWGIVEKNQEKISNLVMDMLTFSKERDPEVTAANLNQVAAEVVELMQIHSQDANVQLVWRPAEQMPRLTFDPDGLHRAILNVVTNAIDACDGCDKGHVEVSTKFDAKTGYALIQVVDNGVGIGPNDLKKVFVIFESQKGGRGTGLGLSVSQKIMQEHGGEIEVKSTLGEGSCFVLRLPVVLCEDSEQPLPPATRVPE